MLREFTTSPLIEIEVAYWPYSVVPRTSPKAATATSLSSFRAPSVRTVV